MSVLVDSRHFDMLRMLSLSLFVFPQVLASVALMIYVVRRARRELASLTSEQDVEIGDNV